jgi:hypothetical protein
LQLIRQAVQFPERAFPNLRSDEMKIWGFVLICVLSASLANAATINATSCNQSQVATAISSANTGDTIVIPAGTCTWTTTLAVSKSITLQGQGVNSTVIVDGITAPSSGAKPPAIRWTVSGNALNRLTGVTFDGGSVGGLDNSTHSGIVSINGSGNSLRMDHLTFTNLNRTVGVQVMGNVTGVIDHVIFNIGSHYGLYIFHDNWQGVGGYGDNSWAQPNTFGSADFLFVEDCQFLGPSGSGISWGSDGWMGQRVVFRRDSYVNVLWANHGTETSGRERSGRAAEVYQNSFVLNNAGWNSQLCCLNSVIGLRGGTAMIWGNQLSGSNGGGARQVFDMANLRSNDPRSFYIFNHCDGTNPWDQNAGPEVGYRCIDQPGAGQGDLLSGDTPAARWLRQQLEPLYIWGNSNNGSLSSGVPNGAIPVVSNREYYNEVPGFNGTSGMGNGPASARPATCNPGVAYWANDQGEWDSTNGSTPDGVLYICTSANTWTLAYTPYQYPHPLVSGASAPPSVPAPVSPTNLSIQ